MANAQNTERLVLEFNGLHDTAGRSVDLASKDIGEGQVLGVRAI